ncbi:hypothetical protein HPB50_011546 [Hyalomma asiaticum]|uniref:Uncharacterized protein n=1 Tax=Hyalomma asiaticum TaxID=266040 RepID=A0ACB7T0I1_HYAAI|nr:hypothetical protein HPB50_011546 [Hyalomma asiaticum]
MTSTKSFAAILEPRQNFWKKSSISWSETPPARPPHPDSTMANQIRPSTALSLFANSTPLLRN